jgi:hypothetical protein
LPGCDASRKLFCTVRSLRLSVHGHVPHGRRSWWCHARRRAARSCSREHSRLHHSPGHCNADAEPQPCARAAARSIVGCQSLAHLVLLELSEVADDTDTRSSIQGFLDSFRQ